MMSAMADSATEFKYHLIPGGSDIPWEAVLAWKCERCGEWIREFGGEPRTTCRPGEGWLI